MNTLLMRVKRQDNIKLEDDEFIESCMTSLMGRYPDEIHSYEYERDGDNFYILLWGDFTEAP